jgi:N-6 DNA Methylase
MADPKSTSGAPTVTLAQIAELAGVTQSAVSNWRKRYDDFPSPVSSTASGRDLFSLPALYVWLASRDRPVPPMTNESILFEAADMLRAEADANRVTEILCAAITLEFISDDGAVGLLEELGLAENLDRTNALAGVFEPVTSISPAAASRLLQLVGRLEHDQLPNLFESVLARRTRFNETRTSQGLVELLAELTVHPEADARTTIFDPAAGEGGLLLAASRAQAGEARVAGQAATASGQEINPAAWRIARQRFLLSDQAVSLALGDSLLEDAFPDLRADVVVCDPPYNVKVNFPGEILADPRWSFGLPSASSADYAWLQHVVHHLAEEGHGYVLLPTASLSRGGREAEVRAQLVRRGAVEAVVALPPRAAEHTTSALAVWILRRPSDHRDPTPVLLIDASSAPTTKREALSPALRKRISQTLNRWRLLGEIPTKDRDFAVAVPVLDLLGPDASLEPRIWTGHNTVLDMERRDRDLDEAIARIEQARAALATNELKTDELSRDLGPTAWVPIQDLVAEGRARLVRGVRVSTKQYVSEGAPTLRTRDFNNAERDNHEPSCVDLLSIRPRPELTEPGDVVVSPGSGRPKAMVDETGGRVIVAPLQGLRLNGGWITPYLAAAFIESTHSGRFVSGSLGFSRIDLRRVELPIISTDRARALEHVLASLRAAQALARELLDGASEARAALLDVVAAKPQQPDQSGGSS